MDLNKLFGPLVNQDGNELSEDQITSIISSMDRTQVVKRTVIAWRLCAYIDKNPNAYFSVLNKVQSDYLIQSTILHYNGQQATSFVEGLVQDLCKAWKTLSSSDGCGRNECLQALCLLMPHCAKLSSTAVRELNRIVKQVSSISHDCEWKAQFLQLLCSISNQSALSVRVFASLVDDDNYIKCIIRLFEGVSGITRSHICYLLKNLLINSGPKLMQLRLNKISSFQFKDELPQSLIKSMKLDMFSAQQQQQFLNGGSSSNSKTMKIFLMLAAYLTKFSDNRDVILGIFESFHIILRQNGVISAESWMQYFKFFMSLFIDSRFDVNCELTLMKRGLCSWIVQEVLVKSYSGSFKSQIDDLIQQAYLTPICQQLKQPSAEGGKVSYEVVSLMIFCMDNLSSLLSFGAQLQDGEQLQCLAKVLLEQKLTFDSLTRQRNNFSLLVSFAWLCKAYVKTQPSGCISILKYLIGFVEQVGSSVTMASIDSYVACSVIVSYAIADLNPVHFTFDWLQSLVMIAFQSVKVGLKTAETFLLKETASKLEEKQKAVYLKKACSLTFVGFLLLSAFVNSNSEFVSQHLPQIFVHLKSHLVKINKDGLPPASSTDTSNLPLSADGWCWAVCSRNAAMSLMWCLLNKCQSLLNEDMYKRLMSWTQNTLVTAHNVPASIAQILQYSNSSIQSFNSFSRQFVSTDSALVKQSGPAQFNLQSLNVVENPFLISQMSGYVVQLKRRIYQVYSELHPLVFTKAYVARMDKGQLQSHQQSIFQLMRSVMEFVTSDVYLLMPQNADLNKVVSYYSDLQKRICILHSTDDGQVKAIPASSMMWDTDDQQSALRRVISDNLCQTSLTSRYSLGGVSENQSIASQPINARKKSFLGSVFDSAASQQKSSISINEGTSPASSFGQCNIPWFTCDLSNDLHDGLLFSASNLLIHNKPLLLPLNLSATDAAIGVFATLFLEQDDSYKEVLLDQIVKTIKIFKQHAAVVSSANATQNVPKFVSGLIQTHLATVIINSIIALERSHNMLRVENVKYSIKALQLLEELYFESLQSPIGQIKLASSALFTSIARNVAASVKDGAYSNQLFDNVLEKAIQSAQNAQLRAGAIYGASCVLIETQQLNSNASQCRKLIDVLIQLSKDQNQLVHQWSLMSLSRLFEACGMQLFSVVGRKYLCDIIAQLCVFVFDSPVHVPCWGNEQQFQSNVNNMATSQLFQSDICPYNSIMRIARFIMNAIGPELSSGSGKEFGVFSYLISSFVEDLLIQNGMTTCSVSESSLVQSIAVPFQIRFNLKFIAQNYSLTDMQPILCSFLCNPSPYEFTMAESLNNVHDMLLYKLTSIFEPTQLMQKLQLLLCVAPQQGEPYEMQNAVIKLLWQQYLHQSNVSESSFFGSSFVEMLFYFVDQFQLVDPPSGFAASQSQTLSVQRCTEIVQRICRNDCVNGKYSTWLTLFKNLTTRVQSLQWQHDDIEEATAVNVDSTQENQAGREDTSQGNNDDMEEDLDDFDNEKSDNNNGQRSDDKASDTQSVRARSQSRRSNVDEVPGSPMKLQGGRALGSQFNGGGGAAQQQQLASGLLSFAMTKWLQQCSVLSESSKSNVVHMLKDLLGGIQESLNNNNDTSPLLTLQVDLPMARQLVSKLKASNSADKLASMTPVVMRLSEMIAMCFQLLSVATTTQLRSAVGDLLCAIFQLYGPVRDPDFPESSILEQYQAQINSGQAQFMPSKEHGTQVELDTVIAVLNTCFAYFTCGIASSASSVSRIVEVVAGLAGMLSKPDCRFSLEFYSLARLQYVKCISNLYALADKSPVVQDILMQLRQADVYELWLTNFFSDYMLLRHGSNAMSVESPNSTSTKIQELMAASIDVYARNGLSDICYIDSTRRALLEEYIDAWPQMSIACGRFLLKNAEVANNMTSLRCMVIFGQCVEVLLSYSRSLCSIERCKSALVLLQSLLVSQSAEKLLQWLDTDLFKEMVDAMYFSLDQELSPSKKRKEPSAQYMSPSLIMLLANFVRLKAEYVQSNSIVFQILVSFVYNTWQTYIKCDIDQGDLNMLKPCLDLLDRLCTISLQHQSPGGQWKNDVRLTVVYLLTSCQEYGLTIDESCNATCLRLLKSIC
ncbi:hypothetical protein MP228_011980 [Amoeboaphelidium protococcarum]|nr:hypothetical protein MP228_011980 [Amoeboaphelidium protococcarum]